jgi:hypothetical protein
MGQYLRKLYADDPLFIPYSTKKKQPEILASAIIKQNKTMSDTYVIVVVGINQEVMEAIEHEFGNANGVRECCETHKTDQTRRRHIIVQSKKLKAARKTIASLLKTWIRDLRTRLRESIPEHFPIPQINQKFGDNDDNESRDGHVSYMSSCAQSYGSYDNTDESTVAFFTPSNKTNSQSYA